MTAARLDFSAAVPIMPLRWDGRFSQFSFDLEEMLEGFRKALANDGNPMPDEDLHAIREDAYNYREIFKARYGQHEFCH